ncbi:STAS domain-containing protein [Planosporangium thailandense]|uniref:Anti-sigma factor antagonist n=1 Tax=Planosporangium thailandense TaxID=765197 RepID=A0ABX0XVM0_9ACTN|nr:STAS domain-containing protein [Planosporangium thailandense]NJC69244.1 STAS domain-containing protein [Planosporangium thailandense]
MIAADDLREPRRLGLTRSTIPGEGICLSVSGEVDIGTVGQLRDAISEVLDEKGISRLLLDFGLLEFLDSSGIAALVAGFNTAQERGIGFGVRNCHGTVRNVLQVTGVYGVLAADGIE